MTGSDSHLPPITDRRRCLLISPERPKNLLASGLRGKAPLPLAPSNRVARTFAASGLSPPPDSRHLGGTYPQTNPPKRRPLDKLALLRTKLSMPDCSQPTPVLEAEPRRRTLSPLKPPPLTEQPPNQTSSSPARVPPPEADPPEMDIELPQSAFGEGGDGSLVQCPTCSRSFLEERLVVHQRICQKVVKNSAARGVYRRTAAVPAPAKPAPAKRPVPARDDKEKSAEPEVPKTTRWLQQRCAEIEFTLRWDIRSEADFQHAVATLQKLEMFLERLDQCIVPRSGFAKDLVFQELLSRLQTAQAFDAQHGTEHVPMHQAKVINRSERLVGVGEALVRAFGAEEVAEMVSAVESLRRLLRVKVEDANDLRMAQAAIRDANAFIIVLQRHATANGDNLLAAYQKLL